MADEGERCLVMGETRDGEYGILGTGSCFKSREQSLFLVSRLFTWGVVRDSWFLRPRMQKNGGFPKWALVEAGHHY